MANEQLIFDEIVIKPTASELAAVNGGGFWSGVGDLFSGGLNVWLSQEKAQDELELKKYELALENQKAQALADPAYLDAVNRANGNNTLIMVAGAAAVIAVLVLLVKTSK